MTFEVVANPKVGSGATLQFINVTSITRVGSDWVLHKAGGSSEHVSADMYQLVLG